MEHLLTEKQYQEHHDKINRIRWLGFDHDSTKVFAVVSMKDYAKERGLDEFASRIGLGTLDHDTSPVTAEIHDRQMNTEVGREVDETLEERSDVSSDVQISEISLEEIWNRFVDEPTLAFFQSLMFFGLWESAWGIHLSTSHFVRQQHGSQVLDTFFLRVVMQNIKEKVFLESESLDTLAGDLRLTLLNARILLQAIEEVPLERRTSSFSEALRLAYLSTDALEATQVFLPTQYHMGFMGKSLILNGLEFSHTFESSALVQDGWCPALTYSIERAGCSEIEYARFIGPPASLGHSHHLCSGEKCVVDNIDPNGYRTSHVDETCTCDFLSIPNHQLYQTIRRGSTPLVDLDAMLNSRADSNSIVEHSNLSEIPFAAFSHVWSDGLGSHAEDGLPRCQLENLRHALSKYNRCSGIQALKLIWIDSLCIPLERDLRSKAVKSMNRVFDNATAVIVLDLTLKDTPPSPIDTFCVRLLTCGWNRRLWTLAEGFLAQNLSFDLNWGSFPIKKFLEKVSENIKSTPSPIVLRFVEQFGSQLRMTGKAGLSRICQILGGRSTSKPDDEPLILAIMMEKDVSKLTPYHGARRMKELWFSLEYIPVSIPFSPVKRLDFPGFRWAPRSLLSYKSQKDAFAGDNEAQVSRDGLRGNFLLYRFEHWQQCRNDGGQYILHDVEQREFFNLEVTASPVTQDQKKVGFSAIAVDDHPHEMWHKGERNSARILFLEDQSRFISLTCPPNHGIPVYRIKGDGIIDIVGPEKEDDDMRESVAIIATRKLQKVDILLM